MPSSAKEPIHTYVRCAALHGRATDAGDWRTANAAHGELLTALAAIIDSDAHQELFELLRHDDCSVRCWAATHSLPLDEEQAIAVLKRIASGDGFVALNAQVVLVEWGKGTLRLPDVLSSPRH